MDLSCLNGLDVKIEKNTPLSRHTTFKLGGVCPAVIECGEAKTLQEIIRRLSKNRIGFLLMGFGSNILASDKGVNKPIIRYTTSATIIRREGNVITTDASTSLDSLAAFATNQGLDGLTALFGIPGSVGGAIAGNAGAYGEQVSDHLQRVTVLEKDAALTTMDAASIRFSYRDSPFKHDGRIILGASFALLPLAKESLFAKRDQVLRERKFKLDFWQQHPCAGSFFRNVTPSSNAGQRRAAGWFLEQAGAKKLRVNGARPYEEHANIITCTDEGTAQDVYDLSLKMAALVKARFDIDLIREVRLLGEFKGEAKGDPEGFW